MLVKKPRLGVDRRQFLKTSGGALLALAGGQAACAPKPARMPSVAKVADPLYPYLEVSGTPYQCGRAIGKRFAREIKLGLQRREKWFSEIRAFMQADLATRYQPFLDAARRHFPDIVRELEGWADGSGVDFKDLMALNLKAELGTMMKTPPAGQETCGCSTLALSHGDKLLLAHNEDGDRAYADLLFLVKQKQPGKPAFLFLSYPGILPGIGPAISDAGLILTANFISSLRVNPGIPRYFLNRAVLQARNLAEAIAISTHPGRAYSFHFNLASVPDRKIVSVEASVDRHKVHTVSGLYLHTNHLIQPELKDEPQDTKYTQTSSYSRFRVLTPLKQEMEQRLDSVTGDDLIAALSLHQNAPYSPCRHPTEKVRGSTLATSLFDVSKGTWLLSKGQPCQAQFQHLHPFA